MTYTPDRETLEIAALVMGYEFMQPYDGWVFTSKEFIDDERPIKKWQPHLPTTQGKSDLLDVIDAIPLEINWSLNSKGVPVEVVVSAWENGYFVVDVSITNGNKHAALAEAALKVAAMVGAKMKGKL